VATPRIYIRLTHSGVLQDGRPNTGPVLIPDLDVGYEYQHRKVPVYVPRYMPVPPFAPSTPGYIDITASSKSTLSYENGAISKLVAAGVISAVMYLRPEAYTNITRPSATLYPVGAGIWNTDDSAYNYSDGTAWRDSVGVLT
jgi:hypothetical protein